MTLQEFLTRLAAKNVTVGLFSDRHPNTVEISAKWGKGERKFGLSLAMTTWDMAEPGYIDYALENFVRKIEKES